MDASYKIQRGIHVHLIQFFMCPEFWVHIINTLRFNYIGQSNFCPHRLQNAICSRSIVILQRGQRGYDEYRPSE